VDATGLWAATAGQTDSKWQKTLSAGSTRRPGAHQGTVECLEKLDMLAHARRALGVLIEGRARQLGDGAVACRIQALEQQLAETRSAAALRERAAVSDLQKALSSAAQSATRMPPPAADARNIAYAAGHAARHGESRGARRLCLGPAQQMWFAAVTLSVRSPGKLSG